MMRRAIAGFKPTLCLLALAGTATAHDFWIEPSNFRPAPGELIRVGLRVGEHFKGEAVPRNPQKIERLVLAGADGVQPIAGQDGIDPAGVTKAEQPGLYVIGFRSKRSSIELEAEKFEAYLKEEGLGRISEMRAKRGETNKPGREVYSRAAKALMEVGEAASVGFDRVLGFTFEIVPMNNPYALKDGTGDLRVQLLFEGKPAEGIEVFAMNQSEPSALLKGRSDKDGRATFRLSKSGIWMVKAIQMVPAPADVDADWESIWASLTFEVPASKATPDP